MSVNKCILVGRLTKDAETRYMTNGDAVTSCSLATNERWKGKDGEQQEKVEYHNISFFRRLAEIAGEYLKKGMLIYVEGKLATRKWEDKEGVTHYSTSVICETMHMLSSRREDASDDDSKPTAAYSRTKQPQPAKPAQKINRAFDDMDGDIPF